MGFIEGNCPSCGQKMREKCNAWAYGSPIRTCPNCQREFLDKRWREVAIDGFATNKKSARLYLGATAVFLLFTVSCALCLIKLVEIQGSYPSKLLGCVLVGAVGTIGCFVVFLRIVTGYEDKHNKHYMEESRRRLQDKKYVDKLIFYGYKIPDEFMKK